MITILIIISAIWSYIVFRMSESKKHSIPDEKADLFTKDTICRMEMADIYNEIIYEINNSNNHLNK